MVKCIIFDFFNVLFPYSKEAKASVEYFRDKGLTLGAISSLDPKTVKEIAGHYMIDNVYSSCASCLKKTDPLIYERFLQEYGFQGKECIMVDDEQSRLKAAKQVGITTVWLNHKALEMDVSVDYVIANLSELEKINF